MSENLQKLKESIVNKSTFELLDKTGAVTEDITLADQLKINNGTHQENLDLNTPTNFANDVILRVIYHCWLNKDNNATEYLKDCETKQLPNMSFLQRTDLYNWLSGTSDVSKYMKDLSVSGTDQKDNIDIKQKNDSTNTIDIEKNDTKSDLESQAILNNERILLDHNSALRGSKPVNFQYLIKQVDQTLIKQLKEDLKNKNHINKKKQTTSATNVAGSISASNISSLKTQDTRKQKEPIIMIPSAASSLFTMANIKQFLVDGVYISPRDLPPSTQDMIRIEKKIDRIEKPIRFIVVNNTRLFSKQEYWTRVVGVFVSGHEWQFSHYKWSTPQELFQHCSGYYFNFEGDSIPKNISSWNIRNISLDKTKRFKDMEASRYFWNSIQNELYSRGYR